MKRTHAFVAALIAMTVSIPVAAQCELEKIRASDGAAYDLFGSAVSIDSDWVVVGAFWSDGGGVRDAGAAYAYRREGDAWRERAVLRASDGAVDDRFGRSVALSGDWLVVGADKVDVDGLVNAGAAYVFHFDGVAWTESAKLTSPVPKGNDGFGFSVALDGTWIAIGAAGDSPQSFLHRTVQMFALRDGRWIHSALLEPSAPQPGDGFGISVGLSADRLIVGAPGDTHEGIREAGAAYVFERSGPDWFEVARLTGSDSGIRDWLGISVAVDGDRAVAGANRQTHDGRVLAGAAYVFGARRNRWRQEAKLVASDAAAFDNFGVSVGLRGDRVVVGATGTDDGGDRAGSAYVFDRDREGWRESMELHASDAQPLDQFGVRVAQDAGRAVIGAFTDDDLGTDAGSAYVFWIGDGCLRCEPIRRVTARCKGSGGMFTVRAAVSSTLPEGTLVPITLDGQRTRWASVHGNGRAKARFRGVGGARHVVAVEPCARVAETECP